MSCRRAVSLALVASMAIPSGLARVARAEAPSAAAISEAGKHFQRGVTLYNEADYRAALVEFRRAYEIAPNPAVLYNIGQAYFQLQNYAAALSTLGRYLTEAGAGAAHRREVEQTIDTLQARVGKVAVTTSAPGYDITVDDEPVGKTPLAEPVLVSIGRRKISALHLGRIVDSRVVDVAAGDTLDVALSASEAVGRNQAVPPSGGGTRPKGPSHTWWYVAGGLGAVAIGSGVGAYLESRSLASAREKAGASHDDLTSKSHLVTGLSIAADVTGLLALGAGAIAITVSRSKSHEAHLAIAPGGLQLAGTFR